MRKIHGAVFLSLDGVMQAPGGPEEDPTGGFPYGGWTAPHWDESMSGPMGKLFESDFDLLLGRRTYEIFAGYWPHNRDQPIGEKFQKIGKYVVTSSDEPLEWDGSEALKGDPAQSVASLKQGEGPDLLIQGSSELYDALLPAKLVDRLTLITFPVILGSGKRLFSGDGAEAGGWKLAGHHVSSSGVIMASYEAAGDVPTGTFSTKEPSEEELDRRARAEAGTW
jgi:dihydrofolate reductase